MFGTLSEKLQGVFSKLAGKRSLSEENIADAVREVRLALLEADVAYGVTKTFVKRVKEKAFGQEVVKSVSPSEQFIKVVHDELAALMGDGEPSLDLDKSPSVMMVCGLQGNGKTTACAKLARYLKKQGKRVMMAACDLQRPAAVDQLKVLGGQIEVPVFSIDGEKNPIKVAKAALKESYDVLIVDTAGRLHVDQELMDELKRLRDLLNPQELLFVCNATTGQDAVNSAKAMDECVPITGTILTMLDGDTRGGAAISIREVTGKPLKFEGIGERLEDLQLFNPHSMADRILGMGDVVNLVKQAQEHVSEEEAKSLEKKIRKASFTYDDYLKQMQMVKKMGSMKKILKMLPIPGANLQMLEGSDAYFNKAEAMILSMTAAERLETKELTINRRKRVARGSGTDIQDVHKLVKSFRQTKQFLKRAPNRKQLQQMMGGMR